MFGDCKVESVAALAQTTPTHLLTLFSFLASHHTMPPTSLLLYLFKTLPYSPGRLITLFMLRLTLTRNFSLPPVHIHGVTVTCHASRMRMFVTRSLLASPLYLSLDSR
jgi:hypothetical protein